MRDLRDLIAWLRQRLRGEHTVRACVLTVEPVGPSDYLLLLGEADPVGSADPPRLKVRLDAAESEAHRSPTGESFDPATLVNRRIELRLQTGMRQRFGRGAGVQARVLALLSIGEVPIDGELDRERTLQRLRLEGCRFGPATWVEPEDPHHIALIAAECGDARRDVEHVFRPLEENGLIRVHRIWTNFEGPSAERSLAATFERVSELHRDNGLSATLVCRGGGPVEGFRALNTFVTANAAVAAAVPNLIVGLGHAGTPPTALDAIAARSEPTPTAAAVLVRRLVEGTGARAERALAAFDAAVTDDLEAAARIALGRATNAFEAAVQHLVDRADRHLRQLDRAVEQSLLGHLAEATTTAAVPRAPDPAQPPQLVDGDGAPPQEPGLALVTVAETNRVITRYDQLRSDSNLYLHFHDGTVFVRVVPITVAFH
ncbi:exodeoxyribonuclease VII large subunit [Methylobacterium komagatae]|uniref:Exodeoxyribonuclease VII large subunit n=1 Tax=Methylobacterium komagatae TaxID=374425 RepID=A0ABW2BFC4_9HYPH